MIDSLRKLRALLTRRDQWRFGVLLITMVIGAVLEVVGVGAIPVFVAMVVEPERVMAHPLAARLLRSFDLSAPRELLVWGSVALLVLFTFRTIYLLLNYYVEMRMLKNRQQEFSARLFAAYMHAPYTFHLSRNTSELLRNAESETRIICEKVLRSLLIVLRQGIVVFAIVLLLLLAEPLVSLVVLVIMGGGGTGFMLLIYRKSSEYGKLEQEERQRQIQSIQEGLGTIREARMLGKENAFIRRFMRSTGRRCSLERFTQTSRRSVVPTMEYVAVVGLLLIILFLVSLGRPVESIAPTAALFAVALARLKGCLQDVIKNLANLRYNVVSVDPIYEDLLELCGDPSSNDVLTEPLLPPALPLQSEIRLKGVNYTYPGADVPALRDINLTIRRGQRIGLVGPTGSGKSTLADVLLGLLPPQSGTLRVDGQDINGHLQAWQKNLGCVPQSICLLDDSIRRNIALGEEDSNIDDKLLWEALRTAELEGVVKALPDGVDTAVGEHGVRISGGQRQRVGIARALYHDPDVLIMDEATAALDNETERAVMDALERMRKNHRTMIIIAHRLTTVKDCDRLFYLEGGQIIAEGTYAEVSPYLKAAGR